MGWGDTTEMADGGAKLKTTATTVKSRAQGFNDAGTKGGGGAGNPELAAALNRFAAAAGQFADDLGGQLDTAGSLANEVSADLKRATG